MLYIQWKEFDGLVLQPFRFLLEANAGHVVDNLPNKDCRLET